MLWVTMCLFRYCGKLNDFLHFEQVWALTPLWVSMCLFRCAARPKDFSHWTQPYALFLLWISMCFFIFQKRSNDSSHSEQTCSLPLLFTSICFAISLQFWMEHSPLWHLSHWQVGTFPFAFAPTLILVPGIFALLLFQRLCWTPFFKKKIICFISRW